jgi:hypothetical protein
MSQLPLLVPFASAAMAITSAPSDAITATVSAQVVARVSIFGNCFDATLPVIRALRYVLAYTSPGKPNSPLCK